MIKNMTNCAQALRNNMTEAEKRLWYHLRNNQLGIKFRRQQQIGKYIVDFISFDNNLIIEVDGGQHNEAKEDKIRDTWLKSEGYSILRFWNTDILKNIEGVLEKIVNNIPPSPSAKGGSASGGSLSPQGRGIKGREITNHNTIIIGAGPAGITSAIQLKRTGIDFLILEMGDIGGLLLNANLVENYPGLPEEMPGTEVALLFKRQLDQLGIDVVKERVTTVKSDNDRYIVETENNIYSAENIIVASGTIPKRLAEELPEELRDHIFYDIKGLNGAAGHKISIIGGGDAAFDYALNLSHRNSVSIIYRGAKPRCLPLLFRRVAASKTIKLYPNTGPERVGETNPDMVLVAIGRDPAIDFLSGDIKNHLLEIQKMKGLYFAGDVCRGEMRQTSIAVGDGMKAAMEIARNSGDY